MRVDKGKNVMKVRDAFLENPLSTEREVAKKTWLSNWTINNLKQELEQIWAKDEKIIHLIDEDFNIMLDIQKEKKRRLKEESEQINNSDIDKWEQTATRRYSLFRWDATDTNWWLKDITNILQDIQWLNKNN